MQTILRGRGVLLAGVCLCTVWSEGCITKKRPAAHFDTVALAHPVVPSASSSTELASAPDIELEIAPLPPRLGPARTGPTRPRVAPPPIAGPATVEKPAEPLIAPELSAGELSAARAETQQSIDVAEANLAQAQGKTLNAGQQDLVSKVRGFLESAREGMRNGDWPRAKNQAKKAEVLSQQLVENL